MGTGGGGLLLYLLLMMMLEGSHFGLLGTGSRAGMRKSCLLGRLLLSASFFWTLVAEGFKGFTFFLLLLWGRCTIYPGTT